MTTNNCTVLDPCTTAVGCDPVGGCRYSPVLCTPFPCTTSHCDMGECVYNTSGVCNDNTDPCMVETCVPTTGECATVRKNCDDGNACTVDFCDIDGNCVHIPINMSLCDDNDLCTNDTCDPRIGCVNVLIKCSGLNCSNYTCNDPGDGCPTTCIIPTNFSCVVVCQDPDSQCLCPPELIINPSLAIAPYFIGAAAIVGIVLGALLLSGGIGVGAVAIATTNSAPFSVTSNPLYQGNQHASNPIYSPKSKTGVEDGL